MDINRLTEQLERFPVCNVPVLSLIFRMECIMLKIELHKKRDDQLIKIVMDSLNLMLTNLNSDMMSEQGIISSLCNRENEYCKELIQKIEKVTTLFENYVFSMDMFSYFSVCEIIFDYGCSPDEIISSSERIKSDLSQFNPFAMRLEIVIRRTSEHRERIVQDIIDLLKQNSIYF